MKLDLSFADFAVCALLLAVLYLISALEAMWLARDDREITSREGKDLRTASTWAFIGITLTLIAGVLSQMNLASWLDESLTAVPAIFLVHWAIYHRQASKIIDFSAVESQIKNSYKNEILVWAKARRELPFTVDEAVSHLRTHNPMAAVATGATLFNRRFLGVPPDVFLRTFRPVWVGSDEARKLLTELEASGDLQRDDMGWTASSSGAQSPPVIAGPQSVSTINFTPPVMR